MGLCKLCGSFKNNVTNKCYCVPYQIHNPDTMDEDETVSFYASSPEVAAEHYVEKEFYDDPCNPEDFELTFYVGKRKFKATANISVTFSIEEE